MALRPWTLHELHRGVEAMLDSAGAAHRLL